jgi:hypothetical protein
MNTPTSFDLKQIAETFFKEKGTFTIDNVLSLMKTAFEAGYTKGKLQNSIIPPFTPCSASELGLKSFSNSWDQNQCDSIQPLSPDVNKTYGVNILTSQMLDEALKKCKL